MNDKERIEQLIDENLKLKAINQANAETCDKAMALISKLQKQIEAMKLHLNCKHCNQYFNSFSTEKVLEQSKLPAPCKECVDHSKWEFGA